MAVEFAHRLGGRVGVLKEMLSKLQVGETDIESLLALYKPISYLGEEAPVSIAAALGSVVPEQIANLINPQIESCGIRAQDAGNGETLNLLFQGVIAVAGEVNLRERVVSLEVQRVRRWQKTLGEVIGEEGGVLRAMADPEQVMQYESATCYLNHLQEVRDVFTSIGFQTN